MATRPDVPASSLSPRPSGLFTLISTAFVLALGIALAAAAMLLVAGILLEM